MKKKYKVRTGKETKEREYNYIPVRYIIAVLITLFEILAMKKQTIINILIIASVIVVAAVLGAICGRLLLDALI